MTKRSLRFFGFPLILSALTVSACGAKGSAPGANGDDPTATTQGGQGDHGAHLPMLGAVLRLDDLSTDQRTKVMTIADDYKSSLAQRHVVGRALAEVFARSLETGTMDDATIDAKLTELDALAASEKIALATALDGLHAVLTPAQRATLVASIANRHHGKGLFSKHHDGDKSGLHGPLRHLLGDLDLTDAQRQAFEDKLEGEKPAWDHAANLANMKTLGDDFQLEGFDAKSHDLSQLGGPTPVAFATKMRRVIPISIEVLDAGQRAKMAAKIREFAAKMS